MEKRNNFNIQKITGVFLIFSLILMFTLQTSFVNAQEGEVIKSNPLLKEDFLKINKIINKPFLERTSFNPEDQDSNYVQGEILVKYKDEKININSSKGENNANILNNNYSLKTISRFKENNLSLLKIEDNKTVEEKIQELENNPDVEYAQPNYVYYPFVIPTNDTYKNNLWALENTGQTVNGTSGTSGADIDILNAWSIFENSEDIIVAVIDTGVAYNHPDLLGNLWDGTNCKSDTGSALGSCLSGYDFSDNDTIHFLQEALMEHILKQEDGKKRFIDATINLLRAFSLAVPDKRALDLKEEIAFFQAIKSQFVKNTVTRNISQTELLEQNLNQLISKSIMSSGIMDVLKVAGLKRPDISILSEEFMLEIKNLPQKNLALEMYRKLLNDEIKSRFRKNIVKQRSFKEMIENIIKLYTNRSITTVEVIEELLKIAKKIKASEKKGEELDLSEDEVAFYDALSNNKSALDVLGDKQIVVIAKVLTDTIKKNTTSVDWEIRETERAKIRVLVKRILSKYGYPPDMQAEAVKLVLEQAERICKDGIEE